MRPALPCLLLSSLLLAGCELVLPRRDRRDAPPPAEDGAPPGDQGGGGTYAPPDGGAPEHVLDARYAPLRRVLGKPAHLFQSSTAATTIGDTVYVRDLDAWLKAHPVGTPLYEAVLVHERLHAQRQFDAGVDPWIERYLHDTAFMWQEEQLGWYEQLTHLQRAGLQVNAQGVARNLSNYSNLAGPMVSYEAALAWVNEVLAGGWRP